MAGLIRWRKSSYSLSEGNCVEVAHTPDRVLVRDTKLGPNSPLLSFTLRAWRQFLDGLRERADRG